MREGELIERKVNGKYLMTNHGGMIYQPNEHHWKYLLVPVNNSMHSEFGRFWIHKAQVSHCVTPANWIGPFG